MPFPALQPTSRDFTPGNWPVKSYKSQSGAEVRILYGDTRTNMELTLGYDNISDAQAQQFLTHYDETKGTYSQLTAPQKPGGLELLPLLTAAPLTAGGTPTHRKSQQ